MIQIEKFIPGGEALGTSSDGKKIFFWNALPGETVEEYEVTKSKSHYEKAIATKISSTSPYRVEPKDECFLSTSPWQILDYQYELKAKQSLVVEMFREQGIIIDTPPIFTDGKDYYYRNKMEYSLYWDKDAQIIKPSFHMRGSHSKIPITKSSIERPEIFTAALCIIDELNSRHEEVRRYQSILLRSNQNGEVSGGLYENGKPHPIFPNLTDTILGREYSYSPNGFFQINLPVYEMVLSEIKHHISTDKVVDLYSGVGTIGLSVARDRELTLVEVDKSAYGELVKNASVANESARAGRDGNNQAGLVPVLSKSEEALDYITSDATIILDPPRSGCDKKLLDKLLEALPPKIIYLSCNPITQARDAAILQEKYIIDEVKTYNFFPHTPHIENLIILARKTS